VSCKPSADAPELQPWPSGSSPAFVTPHSNSQKVHQPFSWDASPCAAASGQDVPSDTAVDAKQAAVSSFSHLEFGRHVTGVEHQANTHHSPSAEARSPGITVYKYCYEHLELLSPVSF
jgi:hypothetical protein